MAAYMSGAEALEKVFEEEADDIYMETESEEIEEEENGRSVLEEALKHCLRKLGRSHTLENQEFFVNAGVDMLLPLYDLSCNHSVPGLSEATKILNSSPVYAGTIFRYESRLWLEAIYRRLAGRRRLRNPFFCQITRDIPHGIFSVLINLIRSLEGFCEPFVNCGQNNKAHVVAFTSLRPVKQLFALLSGKSQAEVVTYFKRTLTGKRNGSKVTLLATKEKELAFMYKISKGQLIISYYFGEWNTYGFPQHN